MNTIDHLFAVEKGIAAAVINCDITGLSDEDCLQLDTFEKTLFEIHGHALLTLDSAKHSFEPEHMRCDVTGLLSDCLILTLLSID